MGKAQRYFILTACLLSACAALLIIFTVQSLNSPPESLDAILTQQTDKIRLLDHNGEPLSVTYQNAWNIHDRIALYEIPAFLQAAFIQAEDRRFYEHHGQDWRARLHALLQNIGMLHTVRGASTITEQVVRMLHPRPRNLWSKWLEGWEAQRLETRFSKAQLLEFYLNQVPFAAKRRGIVQASRYYFNRDPETLNHKEMLALAVLVRAPSRLDMFHNPQAVEQPLLRLAKQMHAQDLLFDAELAVIQQQPLALAKPTPDVAAQHFVRFVLQQKLPAVAQLRTTLDTSLQAELQGILDQQLHNLRSRHIENGGLLVADHQSGEILAWVVAGADVTDKPATAIDAVTAPRQPGSSLKPLLYAAALEKGWTAATLIEDAPMTEMIGQGLHRYHNYSRTHYGWVSVREALGNSLNIPALKAIQFVGVEPYLALLKNLGFSYLIQHPNFYGDGLALGNAEVSLFEMVQAYAALANRGLFRPLRVLQDYRSGKSARRVLSEPVSSLLGNILSDPDARQLEFGAGTVLNLPVQTAVKTGTSSDFRDSWTLGYNDRYVVGVWMGNLDNSASDGITGSTGPALVLRSTFALLNRQRETQPLYLSPQLLQQPVCRSTGRLLDGKTACVSSAMEFFVPGHLPEAAGLDNQPPLVRLRQPVEGLQIAFDPRLPADKQALEFIMQGATDSDNVEWKVDGRSLGVHKGGSYLWQLRRGRHAVQAALTRGGKPFYQSPQVRYWVK